MVNSFIDLVIESNQPNKVNEMGVKKPERLSGSQMGAIRMSTVNRPRPATQPRSFMEVAVDLTKALRNVPRTSITMEKHPTERTYFPRFPQEIVALMQEAYRLNRSEFNDRFGEWRDVNPTNNFAIHFRTDSPNDYQRSHFPNDGIPKGLRGIGLGYKLYRTLLKYAGYISSNTAGTSEKDKAWGSLLAYKANPDGTPSVDDAHAIIGPSNWMAIDKQTLSPDEKAAVAMRFIDGKIHRENTGPDEFDMDDELIAILPNDYLSMLSGRYVNSLVRDGRITQEKLAAIVASRDEAQTREEERQREAAERERIRLIQAEADARDRWANRILQFGAEPEVPWQVGDFIVVKLYLYQNYYTMPIRKVETRMGNGNFVAVSIRDAIRIDRGEMSVSDARDIRTTRNPNDWVKVNINRIPDLDNVNLNPDEKRWIQSLLHPEVAATRTRDKAREAERQRQETVTANAPRTANSQATYGVFPASGQEIKDQLINRHTIGAYPTLRRFKETSFVNDLRFIVLGPPQIELMRHNWGIPVYIPWFSYHRRPRPVDDINLFTRGAANLHLTNAVTGFDIQAPFVGLGLVAYPLSPVTVDDKLQARRAQSHYYIAGHQNDFGVLAKAEYGAINTNRQQFIYLKVFGFAGRSVSVRLDLLRKLGAPTPI